MKNIFICIGIAFVLTACVTDKTYHGVSEKSWNQLTAEQQQLIIDRDLQQSKTKN